MINPKYLFSKDISDNVVDLDRNVRCQHEGCYSIGNMFYDKEKFVAFWTCQEGHENKVSMRYE